MEDFYKLATRATSFSEEYNVEFVIDDYDILLTVKIEKCEHCGDDIAIRNPMGYCDHLHYPEYCRVCKRMRREKELEQA